MEEQADKPRDKKHNTEKIFLTGNLIITLNYFTENKSGGEKHLPPSAFSPYTS
jgi:hypothetical protein